jgi:uncharacterized membrane protein YsdA (DUF1294 family)
MDFGFAHGGLLVPPATMDSRSKTKDINRRSDKAGLQLWHLILLAALLVSPCLALRRLSTFIDFRWSAAYGIVISLATYAVYGADKDSAQDRTSHWRAPEKLLHGLELAGGWPGAFLAQHRFRHKCSKLSYQFVFWSIVSLHLYAATDFLLNWRLARAIGSLGLHGSGRP